MHISLENILVWLIIALIGGFIGEKIAKRRAPDGIIGATIIGFIGIFLVVGVLHIQISGDPVVASVPLITSIIVAALFVALWSGLFYHRVYRPGYERYYHRRGSYVRRPRQRRRFRLF